MSVRSAGEGGERELDSLKGEPSGRMVRAAEIALVSAAEALDLVDKCFGPSSSWHSELIRYRLSSDFQSDWKVEVGQWLARARQLGYLDLLCSRLIKRARRGTRSVGKDPNDRRHLELGAELAPAMAAHYLMATGWAFSRWEPVTGSAELGDVDLEMRAPDDSVANLQVKAPDQPGRRVAGRVVDGEYDDRVLSATTKAAGQLLPVRGAVNLIVVAPQRDWPVCSDPRFLLTYLLGRTVGDRKSVWLPRADRGWFFTDWWQHVSAVVVLDRVRNIDCFTYPCTVLLNPQATVPALAEWFPRGRVLALGESSFRWSGGEPPASMFPDGTLLES